MMFPEHEDQIKAEAIAAYPNEAVWLITADGMCKQVQNCAEDPTKTFRVSKRQITQAHVKGLLALVHSHPDYPPCPSEADMRGQLASDIPWGIVATDGTHTTPLTWWGKGVERLPLLGRPFVHGVTDCYSLIRDYYSDELGIKLPEFPRTWEWWRNGKDLYTMGVEEAGFTRISADDAKEGDMLWMQINSTVPNHGAVYIGNNLIMHHVTARNAVDATRLSNREPIHRWLPYITHWWRHRERQE